MFATLKLKKKENDVVATEAVEEESSKTLFYVLGLVAAGWAVLLFAIGMRSSIVSRRRMARCAA